MKVSVVIPTYNSVATIQATLDSVLQQKVPPDEILVLDDGSTDNTVSLLDSYKPKITVFQQKNSGVAAARNTLCERARGDLFAFLDHDDIWHSSYLEVQRRHFEDYPNAVAFFTGHVDFYGYGTYDWKQTEFDANGRIEVMDPLRFFKRHDETPGFFGSASFLCVPKRVLRAMDNEPFCKKVSGVDDAYLCTLLPLLGPVVYTPFPLVAYRIVKEAQSTNKLKAFELWVEVFQLLEERYQNQPDTKLSRAFRMASASKRRQYAKRLMGAGRASEARRQLWYSLRNSSNPSSLAKSLVLLLLTHMPTLIQPKWPPGYREWKVTQSESKEDKTSTA